MNTFSEYAKITPWAIDLNALADVAILIDAWQNGTLAEDARQRLARNAGQAQMLGSTAVIPVRGAITYRSSFFSDLFGGASVQSFRRQFREALNNADVSRIVMHFDSPGGTVDGIPEMADEIHVASKGDKHIVAVADTAMNSAAYWLGSQANEVIATPSGQVGSIGVYALHREISAFEQQRGIKTSIISAGKFKAEGNPFEPLSDEARAAIQADVDAAYGDFVKAVARGRSATAADVRNGFGQGRSVMAKEAVAAGLVDRVATMDQVLSGKDTRAKSRRFAYRFAFS